jgi:hypothetical protein
MSKMSEKMYGNSPKMERDEEDGKMKIKKSGKVDESNDEAEDQGDGEAVPMHARHHMERAEMHMKHQREHHMHDHAKHGDKKEIRARHEEEMKMMHKRHEKESGKGE